MAYGFGATFGTTTTDRIVYPTNVTPVTVQTTLIWTYRHGDGGNNLGRMYDLGGQDGPFASLNRLFAGTQTYTANRGFSAPVGQWGGDPRPVVDGWHPFIVRHDASSNSNTPLLNTETTLTVTLETTATGSVNNAAGSLCIGNRTAAQDRNWDGMLAEFARWNRLLTDDEVTALGIGYSPLHFLNGLLNYAPLIRNLGDVITGAVLVATGAKIQPHPRIIYPSRHGKNLRVSN